MSTRTTIGMLAPAVAERLGCTVSGVKNAARKGTLKPCGYIDVGRGVMWPVYDEAAVARYARVNRDPARSAGQYRAAARRKALADIGRALGDLSKPAATAAPTGTAGVSQASPGASHPFPSGAAVDGGILFEMAGVVL